MSGITHSAKARLAAAALVIATLAVGIAVWTARSTGESSRAEPEVFVSGGGPALHASASAAMVLASQRTGLAIPALKDHRFELHEINVEDDVDGVRLPVQVAQLVYTRSGADTTKGRLIVTHITGQQNALSGSAPVAAAVPVSNSAGLQVVRVAIGDQVGFTAWQGNATHHFLFQPPLLSDAEMMNIVLGLFK